MSWAVFVGAKGGVGLTTLLWEMSKALSGKGRVALVDADFSGHRALAVMCGATHDFDAARQGAPISIVKTQGVTAVELTESFDAMLSVTPESTEALATALDTGYDMVYVDASQPFASATRPFMVRASRYVVVVPPTLLGITGARATLNDMARFGFPKDRTAAVMVWMQGRPEIAPAEIERALGVPLIGQIPPLSDRGWRRSVEALNAALLSIPEGARIDSDAITAPNQVQLGERRKTRRTPPSSDVMNEDSGSKAFEAVAPASAVVDELSAKRTSLKVKIHAELGRRMDSMQTGSSSQSDMHKVVEDLIGEIIAEYRSDVGSPEESSQLRQDVLDEALGLGPLEELLRDDAISEIMVNGPDVVYVERGGQLTLSGVRFSSEQQLRQTIDRIITPLGRRIDEAQPMVDARLPDGSRVNAIIAPLALEGGMLTIRRFGKKRMGIPDLLRLGALNEPMVEFIRACVESHLNIVVSGGTGSGKTTLLNIVSNFIPDGDRILTIEDAAELMLAKSHVGRLESRAPNIEGKGGITIRDLVRNALRMRPDRIVVGECRGGEALDMLQAMNTGHDGSLTTLHANSPRDSISRLETLVMMAGYDLPVRAIREQIASAIDLVIQTARLRDGSRKIMAITEVVGMEGDVVTMQDIVKFDMQGIDDHGKVIGEFQYTGVQPKAIARFDDHGVAYDVRELSKMSSSGTLW
ncbi:MAG: hypothetical protein NVSMB64_28670 [Candidatus Velthaea sp.]